MLLDKTLRYPGPATLRRSRAVVCDEELHAAGPLAREFLCWLRKVELVNAPFRIAIEGTVDRNARDREVVDIRIVATMRDRESGAPIDVVRGERFAGPILRYQDMWQQKLFDIVESVFRHEAEECFQIDGVRVFDPHAGEVGQ